MKTAAPWAEDFENIVTNAFVHTFLKVSIKGVKFYNFFLYNGKTRIT